MNPFSLIAGALLALVLLVAPALAQSTAVDGASIFGAWRPYLTETAGILVAAFVGWILNLVRRRTGLEIEAKHRDALQTALTNAAGLVIGKVGEGAARLSFDTRSAALSEGITYVLKSAPDALKYFGVTPESLKEKLEAKLGLAVAAPPRPAPAA